MKIPRTGEANVMSKFMVNW